VTHTIEEALGKFDLIAGAGSEQEGKACVMTLLAWKTGAAWSDQLPCVHPWLRRLAITANDAATSTALDREALVRAGDAGGLIDTWWVPSSVLVVAVASAPKPADGIVAHVLGVLANVIAWKENKQQPVLRGADLRDAVLSGAVLRDAVLSGAVLRGADLSGAVLRDAVLSGAVLRGAVLRGAVLRGADLSDADLSDADLRDADLRDAVLSGAVLRGAVLRDAVLRDAVLSGAVLRGAVLRGAVLSGAVLRDADLSGADLSGADLRDAVGNRWTVLPAGWKVDESGLIVKDSPGGEK
jgi:uncharacterized protein YjbI with pentapeptide repeats